MLAPDQGGRRQLGPCCRWLRQVSLRGPGTGLLKQVLDAVHAQHERRGCERGGLRRWLRGACPRILGLTIFWPVVDAVRAELKPRSQQVGEFCRVLPDVSVFASRSGVLKRVLAEPKRRAAGRPRVLGSSCSRATASCPSLPSVQLVALGKPSSPSSASLRHAPLPCQGGISEEADGARAGGRGPSPCGRFIRPQSMSCAALAVAAMLS